MSEWFYLTADEIHIDAREPAKPKAYLTTAHPQTGVNTSFYVYKYPHGSSSEEFLRVPTSASGHESAQKQNLAANIAFQKAIVPCVRSRDPLQVDILYKIFAIPKSELAAVEAAVSWFVLSFQNANCTDTVVHLAFFSPWQRKESNERFARMTGGGSANTWQR